MNKLNKTKKLAVAMLIGCILVMSMAITVFAETESAYDSVWEDPSFYSFLALVAGFFGIIALIVFLYFKFNSIKRARFWKESESTTKIYEDLEDVKWSAPDSVFIDDVEPTAAILSEVEPVRPIRGLDGFIISETPIEPTTAIKMGADPYVDQTDVVNSVFESIPATLLDETNIIDIPEEKESGPVLVESREPFAFNSQQTAPVSETGSQTAPQSAIFESVRYTVLDNGQLVSEPVKPIEPAEYASVPEISPFTYISPVLNSTVNSFAPANAVVYENNTPSIVLDDVPFTAPAAAPASVQSASTPISDPKNYIREVPITIYTSADADGVVHISAAVYENTVSVTELKDAPVVTPIAETPAAVSEAVTPSVAPATAAYVAEDEAIVLPTEEAAVYEEAISATVLEDEIVPEVAEIPVVVTEAATPSVAPATAAYVAEDEAIVLPAEEAAVYE
nr:hypothetical protein [Oscillospiraceae bacterium]